MGNKYIIELEDKPFHKEDGDFLYRVKGFNSLVFDMTGIGKLTPFKRVRKEAYAEGFKDGQYAERNGLVANYAQVQEIKVGDEVKTKDGQKMVIAAIVNKDFAGLADDGRFMFGTLDETITRTGRHFPEIAAVLEKMREGQDG